MTDSGAEHAGHPRRPAESHVSDSSAEHAGHPRRPAGAGEDRHRAVVGGRDEPGVGVALGHRRLPRHPSTAPPEVEPEEVGRRTTMAVVSAIFAVIVLDAFFAVFFTEIGWG